MEAVAGEMEAVAKDARGETTAVEKDGMAIIPLRPALTSSYVREVIRQAGHGCTRVLSIDAKEVSPLAYCDDGESYVLVRVVSPVKQDLAMKCSAMTKLGVEGR